MLIAGAGIAGLVLAERLCNAAGLRCVVVDRRPHVGGNCYDEYDADGVLLHVYGPHYFRTNAPRIREYLSRFTEWRPVDYKIKSYTEGRYWSFPVNLNTYEELLGRAATTEEFEEWLRAARVPIENPANSEDVIVSQVGWELYRKFFLGYTLKQWKRHPRELDASVCGRIPIRTNRDDRYLKEDFQALPREGYTAMFLRIVEACGPRLTLLLRTSLEDVRSSIDCRHLVYCGAIDEFFEYRFGVLPYRSLRFERVHVPAADLVAREAISGRRGFWQPAMQVNYPNDHDFTRIVEIKHATGQVCPGSTIVREYPEDYRPGGEAYYPVPAPDAAALYAKYRELGDARSDVTFLGRLATYRYYNMDQVVGMALTKHEEIAAKLGRTG
ncbi:MAG: NAD(P)-binding protein [Verrucomicrobiales bacterium]|nr:NAD(P)-binding protein [Verrucomicrobiales bacterium]